MGDERKLHRYGDRGCPEHTESSTQHEGIRAHGCKASPQAKPVARPQPAAAMTDWRKAFVPGFGRLNRFRRRHWDCLREVHIWKHWTLLSDIGSAPTTIMRSDDPKVFQGSSKGFRYSGCSDQLFLLRGSDHQSDLGDLSGSLRRVQEVSDRVIVRMTPLQTRNASLVA